METNAAETRAGTDFSGAQISWAELLEAYRIGPKDKWSRLLIARLGPWLTTARQQLHAVPPYLDRDDVAQQLVVEVLQIALRWRPVCEDHWIPRRLVERAARKVLKTVLAERLDQTVELNLDLEAGERAEPEMVVDTPIGTASLGDLRVIYRASVLGEPIEVLAAETGVTQEQMRRRLKSARARVRAAAQLANR